MQPVVRGESRARRSASSENPYRLRPSRSLSPGQQTLLSSSQSLILSFLHALAFFIPTSSISPPLLLLPAFLFASLVLYIYARLRASSLSGKRIQIVRVSIFHLAHAVCVVLAVSRVGPSRALVALGMIPKVWPRKRLWVRVLVMVLVVGLLAGDAPGKERSRTAGIVRGHLHALAGRVRTKYEDSKGRIAERIHSSAKQTSPQNDSPIHKPDIPTIPIPPVSDPIQNEPNGPPHLEAHPQKPQEPSQPGGDGHNPTIDINTVQGAKTEGRRKLLAIVKGETLFEVVQPIANGSSNQSNKTLPEESNRETKEKFEVVREDAVQDPSYLDYRPSGRSLSGIVGVLLASYSVVFMRSANEATARLVQDGGEWVSIGAVAFFQCAVFILPFSVLSGMLGIFHESLNLKESLGSLLPRGALLAVCLMIAPSTLRPRRRDVLRRAPSQRTSKTGMRRNAVQIIDSALSISRSAQTGTDVYSVILLSVPLITRVTLPLSLRKESFSAPSLLAVALLLFLNWWETKAVRQASLESGMRDASRSSSSGNLSVILGRSLSYKVRHTLKFLISSVRSFGLSVHDLFSHAKTNKASWQVLNFLVLQSGMVVVELAYASIYHAAGLISVSADNFVCCIALAIGLCATKMTAKQQTPTHSYGYSRLESMCGFTNGIMLFYVAVLIVLEAFERLVEEDRVGAGHTFTVCVFGMIGNILGLYFFPPETRRENHNVQGIYLHILANTLAFTSMAISTAVTTAVPAWEVIDMVTAAIAAIIIVLFAGPLVLRSGRLLLLQVPREKQESLRFCRTRLSKMEGVVNVSDLRVWNLTPNCLVASVCLEVAEAHKEDNNEVLYKARAIFATLGVPASQCTIQITRVACANPSIIFFHKRTASGLAETGIDLEALTGSRTFTGDS